MRTLDLQVTTKISSSCGLLVLFNVCCGTQTQLADLEQSHGLCESLARQREEAQREAERLRSSFREAEQTLGARERAHRHRVKGLEEQVNMSRDIGINSGLILWSRFCRLLQVSTLKEQLLQEMKRRQPSLPSPIMPAGN